MENMKLIEEFKEQIDNDEIFKRCFIKSIDEFISSDEFIDYMRIYINSEDIGNKEFKGINDKEKEEIITNLLKDKYYAKFYNTIEGLKIILNNN